MLSLTAMRLLSDPEMVSHTALRLFLRLCCDYDLARFKVLNTNHLMVDYGLSKPEISKSITQLVALGILERGPLSKRPVRLNTYRIRPVYLLSPEELALHFQETRERRERETLTRKVAPVVV
jgi:hypothetical protein